MILSNLKGRLKMRKVKLTLTRANDLTYQDLFEDFIKHKKIIGLAGATITSYQNNHKYFDVFSDAKNTNISDMNVGELLNDYVEHLQPRSELRAITINIYLRQCCTCIEAWC